MLFTLFTRSPNEVHPTTRQPLQTLPRLRRPDAGDEAGNLLFGRVPTPVEGIPSIVWCFAATTASVP
jgi:hypothetical protein